MNVLFLSLLDFSSIKEHNIYTDLLREFSKHNHNVYVISPTERRKAKKTHIIIEGNVQILKLKIGNIQKTNVIEKGFSTLLIEPQMIFAIKKYFSNVKFDLVIYSTPPITFCNAVEFVKKRDGAKSYLLLKDIFPQNAVDIGLLSQNGIKGLIYRAFKKKEKKLYTISDRIGCMSPANVGYLLSNNKYIDPDIVEVCPNSVEPIDLSVNGDEKEQIRAKYHLPLDKKIFVYGGNLGKPQGIPFLIECLKAQEGNTDSFFLIIGDGTEYGVLEQYVNSNKLENVRLMCRVPVEEYNRLIAACDTGLIFLDYRFSVPNFPSRLLGYLQAGLPVIAATDPVTDIGRIIEKLDIGMGCFSNDVCSFNKCIEEINKKKYQREQIFAALCSEYSTEKSYEIIMGGGRT